MLSVLSRALQEAHRKEEDPETGMAIAAAIEVLKDSSGGNDAYVASDADDEEAQIQGLIEQIKSDKAEQIVVAAEKLGEMGAKLAVEPLILAFNNQKHTIHVRLAIAEALLKLESAPVEVTLLANLRHSDWHNRRNAAAILGQLQAEWAIEPLSRILSDPHPVVRRTALAALKHIGTPESRKALAQHAPGGESSSTAPPQEAPGEVSGIEVKRPGKKLDDSEESTLLKRLREKQEEERRHGTKPLDPSVIEATQPIRDTMLDQLDALLDDDEDDDS